MARTLLLGLDSMTFTILDSLVEEGRMPFLARLLAEGVRAELLSTPNPLTPPAWTTLMTGCGPGAHGIYDFIRTEERENGPFFVMINSNDVRCETIWSMANRQGRRVICLNFPAMFPVKPIDGFVVPGYITARQFKTSVYPRDLYHRLLALSGFNVQELAWNKDDNRKALNALPPEDYERWIASFSAKDHQLFLAARMLLQEERWDLAAILFEGMDRLQHLCWRFLDPEMADSLSTPWERRTRELSVAYFERLDGQLAELVRLAGPETRVFLVSDHGAGSTTEIFSANAWLAERGYLVWKEDPRFDDESQLSPMELRDYFLTIDWSRTKAYARSASANGIYIRKAQQPGWGGVTEVEYPAFRAKMVDELLAWRDPRSGDTVVKQVRVRDEAFPGPHMEHAPDLTLTLRDGGFLSILPSKEIVKPRPQVSGMHRPEGIFIGTGPGIRKGSRLQPRGIADMAPTLLYSLGLPIPCEMEGKLIEDAFEPSLLETAPPRIEGSAVLAEPSESEETMTAEDEATVLERLRQLGYID